MEAERFKPAFVSERNTAITPGVTVWGAICWDSLSPLVVLQGTLTARRYVDAILQPATAIRPGTIYEEDNARSNIA